MPTVFPLIVFTKHRSRFQPVENSSFLESLWFRLNSVFSMHSIFVTYYIPENLSPRLLESLLTKDSKKPNSFHGMTREGIEKLFQDSTNYLKRVDIRVRKDQILNRPASIPKFANIPKMEGGKYVDYKNKSFTEKLKQSFKDYIRNRFGFFAFILQILYDICLHLQFSDYYPLGGLTFMETLNELENEVGESSKSVEEVGESSKSAQAKENVYLE